MAVLAILSIRLFIRFLLGLILISTGISKLAHQNRFRQGILDYKVLPSGLVARFPLAMLLASGISFAELLAGLGLVSGLWLAPAILLTIILFGVFSSTMIVNLLRGRNELSCHCGGIAREHRISWWLVGRNGLLIGGLLFLLVTPMDMFTVATLVRSPSTVSATLWVNIVLPVALIAGMALVVLALFNAARTLFHS